MAFIPRIARIDISVILAKAGIQHMKIPNSQSSMTNQIPMSKCPIFRFFNHLKISHWSSIGHWSLVIGHLVLFFVLCSLFFAATVSAVDVVNLPNPLGATDIPTLLGRIIKGFLGITGSIALVMFIYGGITWLTSAGNADKIKKGRDIFLWSVVGLFIIFGSYLMVDFVITKLTKGGEATENIKCCIKSTTQGYECKQVSSIDACQDGNPSPVSCGQEKPKVCQ